MDENGKEILDRRNYGRPNNRNVCVVRVAKFVRKAFGGRSREM